jgi:hypothetical protein
MKNLAAAQSLSLQPLSTIKLPVLGPEPGPLHTILQDNGSIYYSDEINHSVVSLTSEGEVRWHKSKKGNKPGEFIYPKGIEIGWIAENANKVRCIAVCDSWNRRIQFFDTDGSFLTAWGRTGEINFNEPVDVRFIGAAEGADSPDACWLILDRGHHSLFGLSMSRDMIFRIGRCFPDNLESRWPVPCNSFSTQATSTDRFSESLPYDPLFMPSRIFGKSQEAIYLLEPKSQRIKHAIQGNLLPVWRKAPRGAEWIGADEGGFLCFEREANSLASYDINAKVWLSAPIDGTPVICGRKWREIWTQDGLVLRHGICSINGAECGERSEAKQLAIFELTDEIESRMKTGLASTDIAALEDAARKLRDAGKRAIEISKSQLPDMACLENEKANLASSAHVVDVALHEMQEFNYIVFLGLLKIVLMQSMHSKVEGRQYFKQALEQIKAATKSIEKLFEELVLLRDNLLLSRLEAVCSIKEHSSQSHDAFLQDQCNALMEPIRQLAKWMLSIPVLDSSAEMAENAKPCSDLECWQQIARYKGTLAERKSSYLREIDCITLDDVNRQEGVWPINICQNNEGGFLVTLNNCSQIIRLDEKGKALGAISLSADCGNPIQQPHGIAVDENDRIWVTVPLNNSVLIIDPSTNRARTLESMSGRPLNMKYPTGIHRTANGQMLIADTQNSRIMIAAIDGQVQSLVNQKGQNIGEILHPVAFSRTADDQTFWVVEIRNHRLQRFSLHGKPLEQFGGAGMDSGKLVLPESAAMFDDGMQVVSQRQIVNILKLFSSGGKELEALYLAWPPWAVLTHKNRLFVCEGFSNHIHIFERNDAVESINA